ncbi:hypothetical protein Tco_0956582 [Tanacetum coccineum]
MSSSVAPVRRYCNPASRYESYRFAVHSELPNSTQRNVPKPIGKPGPPNPTVPWASIDEQKIMPESPAPLQPHRARSLCADKPIVVGGSMTTSSLGAAVDLSPTSYPRREACGGKCSDDGGGGNGGDSEMSGDGGGGGGKARSLSTSSSDGKGIGAIRVRNRVSSKGTICRSHTPPRRKRGREA